MGSLPIEWAQGLKSWGIQTFRTVLRTLQLGTRETTRLTVVLRTGCLTKHCIKHAVYDASNDLHQ